MTSIDNAVRIDHGNDFTLVDAEEYNAKLDALFYFAKDKLKTLDSKFHSKDVSELKKVLAYESKGNEDKRQLYSKYFLNHITLKDSDPLNTLSAAISISYTVDQNRLLKE